MAKPKPDYKFTRRNIPDELWPEVSRMIEQWKLERKKDEPLES